MEIFNATVTIQTGDTVLKILNVVYTDDMTPEDVLKAVTKDWNKTKAKNVKLKSIEKVKPIGYVN